MNRRRRAALDDPHQVVPLRVGEDRAVAWCLAVHQAGRSLGVEGEHPVPDRLQPDPADLRRLASGPAVINCRECQQAPGLIRIVRSLRQPVHSQRAVIPSKPNRSRHGNPPLGRHG